MRKHRRSSFVFYFAAASAILLAGWFIFVLFSSIFQDGFFKKSLEVSTNVGVLYMNAEEDFHLFYRVDNKSKTFVSYSIFAPMLLEIKERELCLDNADLFISRGVVESSSVDFNFNLIGGTLPTKTLASVSSLRNVKLSFVQKDRRYLFSHMRIIKSLKIRYDYYIILDCRARGPYFPHRSKSRPLSASIDWMVLFTNKLRKVGAVSSTISFEVAPHIQTYAVAFDYRTVRFAVDYCSRMQHKTNFSANVAMNSTFDVDLSTELLKEGFSISSLDSRSSNVDFRKPRFLSGWSTLDNPVSCHNHDGVPSLGCRGVDPCEVAFVQIGGDASRDKLVPQATIDRYLAEDRKAKYRRPVLCNVLPVILKPIWDIPMIFKNLTTSTSSDSVNIKASNDIGITPDSILNQFSVDTVTDIVILIRVHASYMSQMLSMLWMIEASAVKYFEQVRIVVHSLLIPTL
jgi:hypothetical protein